MTPLFPRPIAHRGLHDRGKGVIENSAAAFEAAIAHGYDIECDVQLSSDGVPFIFHDDTFDRLTAASGPSGDRPMSEVRSLVLKGSADNAVPQTLEEFLAQVAGSAGLQVELKQQPTPQRTAALANAVAAQIASYSGPLTLESFDPNLIRALRRAGVSAPIGIVTYDYNEPDWDASLPTWQKFVLRHQLHWPWTRFDFISCRGKDLGLPAVRFFRSLGVEVTAWTIESPEQAASALKHADQIVFEGYLPQIG